jgi:hypothetical protein
LNKAIKQREIRHLEPKAQYLKSKTQELKPTPTPLSSEDHPNSLKTGNSSTTQGEPLLFYFSNDQNINQLKFFDTEIDQSLDN